MRVILIMLLLASLPTSIAVETDNHYQGSIDAVSTTLIDTNNNDRFDQIQLSFNASVNILSELTITGNITWEDNIVLHFEDDVTVNPGNTTLTVNISTAQLKANNITGLVVIAFSVDTKYTENFEIIFERIGGANSPLSIDQELLDTLPVSEVGQLGFHLIDMDPEVDNRYDIANLTLTLNVTQSSFLKLDELSVWYMENGVKVRTQDPIRYSRYTELEVGSHEINQSLGLHAISSDTIGRNTESLYFYMKYVIISGLEYDLVYNQSKHLDTTTIEPHGISPETPIVTPMAVEDSGSLIHELQIDYRFRITNHAVFRGIRFTAVSANQNFNITRSLIDTKYMTPSTDSQGNLTFIVPSAFLCEIGNEITFRLEFSNRLDYSYMGGYHTGMGYNDSKRSQIEFKYAVDPKYNGECGKYLYNASIKLQQSEVEEDFGDMLVELEGYGFSYYDNWGGSISYGFQILGGTDFDSMHNLFAMGPEIESLQGNYSIIKTIDADILASTEYVGPLVLTILVYRVEFIQFPTTLFNDSVVDIHTLTIDFDYRWFDQIPDTSSETITITSSESATTTDVTTSDTFQTPAAGVDYPATYLLISILASASILRRRKYHN